MFRKSLDTGLSLFPLLLVLLLALTSVDAVPRPCNCYNGEVWQEEPDCRCICYVGYFLPECRYTADDKVKLKVWINVTLKEFQNKGIYQYEQIFEKNLGLGKNSSDRIHILYIDKVYNATFGNRRIEKVSIQVQMTGQQAEYLRYDFVAGQHWLEVYKIESAYPDDPAPTNPPETVFWDVYFWKSPTYGNISVYSLWWLILAIFILLIFFCMEFCCMQNIENIVWDHIEAGTLVYVGEEEGSDPEAQSLNPDGGSSRNSSANRRHRRRSSASSVDYDSEEPSERRKKQKKRRTSKTQEDFEKQAKSSKRGGFIPLDEQEESDEEMLVQKKQAKKKSGSSKDQSKTAERDSSSKKRGQSNNRGKEPREDVASPKHPAAMEWSTNSGMTPGNPMASMREDSRPPVEEGDASIRTKEKGKNPLLPPTAVSDASMSLEENPVKLAAPEPEKPKPTPKPKPKPKGKFAKKAAVESTPSADKDKTAEEPPKIAVAAEKGDTNAPAPAPKPKPKPKPKGKFSKITTRTNENPNKEAEGYVPEQRRIRYDEDGNLLDTSGYNKSVSLRQHEVTAEDIEQTEYYRAQLLDLYKKYDVRPPLFSKLDKELARWRGKEDAMVREWDKLLASGDLCGGTKGGDTTRRTVVDPETGKAKTIIETEVDAEKSWPPSEEKFQYRNSRQRKD